MSHKGYVYNKIIVIKKVLVMGKEYTSKVNMDNYAFIPTGRKEYIKKKLESADKRWKEILDIIDKSRKTKSSG